MRRSCACGELVPDAIVEDFDARTLAEQGGMNFSCLGSAGDVLQDHADA